MRQWMLILAVLSFMAVGLLIVQGQIEFGTNTLCAVCTSPDADEVWERTASWDATVSLLTYAIALHEPRDAAIHDQMIWNVEAGLLEINLICAAGIIPRSPPSAASA